MKPDGTAAGKCGKMSAGVITPPNPKVICEHQGVAL